MRLEHLGFVLVAQADCIGKEHLVLYTTIWLAIIGVPSFITDCIIE
jgi:hypothetical protein